jgi:hypothetical protein
LTLYGTGTDRSGLQATHRSASDISAPPCASIVSMAKRKMSDDHKAALAEGRTQGRAVRNYLEALETYKPKRGRKRTPESIDAQYPDASPVRRLELNQQRIDLEAALIAGDGAPDLSALEAEFVASAKGYGERKGITYAAWRATGIDAAVLTGVPQLV